jgi:hypothetical protein
MQGSVTSGDAVRQTVPASRHDRENDWTAGHGGAKSERKSPYITPLSLSFIHSFALSIPVFLLTQPLRGFHESLPLAFISFSEKERNPLYLFDPN